MATANPYVSFNSPVPYICLVCGSCHAWNGTLAPACLRHQYFHTQCFVCKIDFVFLAAAVDHFNAHSVAAMMGYRHFPPALPDELRNTTVCPPTYLPNMTMLDHSPHRPLQCYYILCRVTLLGCLMKLLTYLCHRMMPTRKREP